MAVVVAVGVVLRFLAASPLWLDEALTVNVSRLPLADLPDALRQDGLPPLYYAFLHVWMQVFGDGDTAVRALSGLFGVISLPLVWLAGCRLAGRRVGWIALVLVAASPYAIRYSSEARMYSLVMVLVLVGWLCLDVVLDDGPTDRRVRRGLAYAGVVLSSGALLLTHYWSMWLLGAVILVLGFAAWRAPDRRRRLLAAAAAVAGGGLLFLPWLPIFLDQLQHTGTPWAGPVRPTTFVSVTVADFGTGAGRLRDGEVLGVWLVVLGLLGLFARTLDRRRLELDLGTVPPAQYEVLTVVVAAALAVAASWVADAAYQTRYAAGLFTLVVLVAAVGASRFTGRAALAAVVGGYAVLGLGVGAFNATVDRTQVQQFATAIESGATDEDLVVYCPDQLGPSTSRLLDGDLEQVTYPDLDRPETVDWRDYEARHEAADPGRFAEEVVELAAGAPIWLVASADYDPPGTACDLLRDELAGRRSAEVVVPSDGGFFEHGSLYRFAAP